MSLVSEQAFSVIQEMKTNNGETIKSLSEQSPVLLVFLRHFGCVFCKEALADLSRLKSSITENGIQLAFVHMASGHVANDYFEQFKLDPAIHVSNPEKNFYTAFGLMKGTISQLYGLRTWIRGFSSSTSNYKLELAEQLGDSTQMPGMFLISKGKVIKEFIHKRASERPDYQAFIKQGKASL